jgi:hypothetical protein
MNAALVIACISGAVALASAALSRSTQLQVAKLQKSTQFQVTELESKLRAEERQSQAKSDAKVVLDRYRGPLLDAAWQLGDRVNNIRHSDDFRAHLSEGSSRCRDARLTTLFRFAHYLGWRELVRTEVQLLQFEKKEDTKRTASVLNDVTSVLASDELDHQAVSLWSDQQRGIGELMTERSPGASPRVRGHASFHDDYDEVFAPWMERFADDLLFDPPKGGSDRMRLLQWALYGVVRQLDEEGVYDIGWFGQTAAEIEPVQKGSIAEIEPAGIAKYEERIRDHISKCTSIAG